MSVSHKNMPDAQRHEPKGISSAAAGYVYQADGVGSGTWTSQLATIKNRNYTFLFGRFDDISTASSIFIPNPILGVISKIYVTLQGPITIADSIITAEIAGVLVTGSSLTAAFAGSAAGSTFSSTPSGANTVAAGQAVEVITDGASTTAAAAIVCVVMDVT
jgi:hypothetical protein